MARSFYDIPEINYMVSTKDDGSLDFRFGEEQEVIEMRKIFLKKIGQDLSQGAATSLVHEDEVYVVGQKDLGAGMSEPKTALKVDALITNLKGAYLFMLIADCFPLSLYDPVKKVVGLVHLGWKGVDHGLTKKAISKMSETYGSNTEDILVNIGPGIRKESYLFRDPVQKSMHKWQPYLKDAGNGLTSIDLVSYIENQLKETGIKGENIFDEKIDTFSDLNYFSHYRVERSDEKEGRFAAIIGLK